MAKKKQSSTGRGWGQLPLQVQSALHWFLWAARSLLVLALLFACLALLHYAGMAPQWIDQAAPNSLEAQVEYDANLQAFRYTAHASGLRTVEIGFQDRILRTELVPKTGIVEGWLDVPRQVDHLWLRAYDSSNGPVKAQQIIFNLWDQIHPFPPTLDMAIFIPEENLIWVAGQLTPGERGVLETPDGEELLHINPDTQGMFDEAVSLADTPFEDTPPSSLLVRLTETDVDKSLVFTSEPLALEHIPLASLPLRRRMELHFNTSQPTVDIEIVLPRNHPYFSALAQGLMAPGNFVDRVLGSLPIVGIQFTNALQIQPVTGTLKMSGSWTGPISNFWFYANNYAGVGKIPFRPGKDEVRVHFDGVGLAWVEAPQAIDQIDEQTIAWRPPADDIEGSRFEIGLRLPPDVQPIDVRHNAQSQQNQEGAEQEEAVKFREFLASFEYDTVDDFVRETVQVVEFLIPFGLVFWYARRRHLGRDSIWPPVAALALVLGLLSTWWYLQFLLEDNLGNWLVRTVLQIFQESTPFNFNQLSSTQIQLSNHNAFFLLLVALASQIPFYLLAVEYRLENPPLILEVRRSWLKTLGNTVRLVLVAMLLILLTYVTRMHSLLVATGGARGQFPTLLQQGIWILPPVLGGEESSSIHITEPLTEQDALFTESLLLSPVATSFLKIVLVGLLLGLLNWRGIFYCLGLLLVYLRFFSYGISTYFLLTGVLPPGDYFLNDTSFSGIDSMSQIPWWAVLTVAGSLAYPFIRWLVQFWAPKTLHYHPRWPGPIITFALLATALALPHLPIRLLLVASGALFFVGLGWTVIYGLRQLSPVDTIYKWACQPEQPRMQRQQRRWFTLVLFLLSLVFVIPIALPSSRGPDSFTGLQALGALINDLDGLFFYILGLALILALRDYAVKSAKTRFVLPTAAIDLAVLLFAVFVINSSARFLFIPVPLVLGWLVARHWLLRPAQEVAALEPALEAASHDRPALLRDTLSAIRAQRRMEAIQTALDKKLESTDLTPEQHKEKLDGYTNYLSDDLELEAVVEGVPSNQVVFATGEGTLWDHTRLFVRYGALLATIPILIALYEYLPQSSVTTPYPLVRLLAFLLRASFSWLIYAFYFGYFYVHLRGNSGLTKGLFLFVALAIPYAGLYLLRTQTLEELRPFLFWLAQIFLFCTFLGLLAVEYRLLRRNGQTMRDLIEVHNLPALALYASSIIAFIAPTIPTLLRGEVGKLVEFFLKTVLPSSGP